MRRALKVGDEGLNFRPQIEKAIADYEAGNEQA